jgi:hypothetical protein
MRTFLLVQLDSEGAPFSEVAELLEDAGFRPHEGGYDFVYDWNRAPSVRESLELADRVQATLKGKSVYFRLESSEDTGPSASSP